MLCFLCGKEITWLRSLVDRQYCSVEHRKEARLASTQVLREDDDTEEIWSVQRKSQKKKHEQQIANSNQASVVAFLTLAALLVAMLMLPKGGAPGGLVPSASPSLAKKPGMFSTAANAVGEFVRGSAPVTLRHDFRNGLNDWTTVALNAKDKVDDPRDWKTPPSPTSILPGTLRIWNRSKNLHNYQMEFQGGIEKRSLSWAFRATDQRNYYGSKLVITRPGPQPNAGLVHYAIVEGQEWDRVQLPLPLTLVRGTNYRIRLSVQDNRFVTYLNGQMVSAWTDNRLNRGGIGFFADNADEQSVAWVNLSERDSFLGRMLSNFGLFIPPSSPLR